MLFSARYFWGTLIGLMVILLVFSKPVFAQWSYDGIVPIISASVTGIGCTTVGNVTTCNQATTFDINARCQDIGAQESGCILIRVNASTIAIIDPPEQDVSATRSFSLACGDTSTYTISGQDRAGNLGQITHTIGIDCTFTVACSPNSTVVDIGQNVVWSGDPNPNTGPYSYNWQGAVSGSNKTVVSRYNSSGTYQAWVSATKNGITETSPVCSLCVRANTSSCPTYCGYNGGTIADGCGGTVTCPGQPPCGFSCNIPATACINDRNNTPAVDLSWSSSLGANSYFIYHDYGYVGNTSGLTYRDQNVVRNLSYNYQLMACSGWGCTVSSCQSVATPWCDFDPPDTRNSLYTPILETCYTPSSFAGINPLQATIVDQLPSPPYGNAGIRSVQFMMKNNDSGATSTPRSASFNSGTGRWVANVPVSDMISGIGAYGNRFDVLIEATDNANLSSGFQAQGKNFEVRSNCAAAFLQTTGGSVHSNENIDVPNRNAP